MAGGDNRASGRLSFLVVILAVGSVAGITSAVELETAIKGYCPIAYREQHKPVLGDPAHHSAHQGVVYFFTSAEAKKRFDADPAKHVPQFGGLCTTALGGTYGNRFEADPEVFAVYADRLFLFSSIRARRAFETSPNDFVVTATSRFRKPALDGYCPVAYQEHSRAVRGSETHRFVYRGKVYNLLDRKAVALMEKDPKAYLPQYDGMCPVAAASNQRFPGDPKLYYVSEGKTYLFFDHAAQTAFMNDPTGTIERADANWPSLKKAPR